MDYPTTRPMQLAAVPKLRPPPEMVRGIPYIAVRDGVRVLCTLLRHAMNASSARMKDENSALPWLVSFVNT